jgi:hypothetical protein
VPRTLHGVLARVPLDVDLEDRLLYGLTPMRLAYAVGALLAAFALWSTPWGPAALRAVGSSLVIGAGAIMSWGRWRGMPADGWVVNFAIFIFRTHRLILTGPPLRIPGRHASSNG